MRRREFIAGMVGAAFAMPRVVRAQQAEMPVVGFLHPQTAETAAHIVPGFRAGLQAMGFAEDRNVTILLTLADGQNDRLPALASSLVRRRVALIVSAGGLPTALAAKSATSIIPIIFETGVNPVDSGLVASLARPGGNLTGMTGLNFDLSAKRFDLMHETVPTAASIALLVNPSNRATEAITTQVQAAAHLRGVRLLVLNVSNKSEMAQAFAALVQERGGALMTTADPIFLAQCGEFAALTARYQLPGISPFREFTAVGGLLSYGTSLFDLYYQVGLYAGRILKGENPADLPVQQITRIKLVLNIRTAKALGLTIPETLLATADEVIE